MATPSLIISSTPGQYMIVIGRPVTDPIIQIGGFAYVPPPITGNVATEDFQNIQTQDFVDIAPNV